MIDHLFGRPNPYWKRTQVGCAFLLLWIIPTHRNRPGLFDHILLDVAHTARKPQRPPFAVVEIREQAAQALYAMANRCEYSNCGLYRPEL